MARKINQLMEIAGGESNLGFFPGVNEVDDPAAENWGEGIGSAANLPKPDLPAGPAEKKSLLAEGQRERARVKRKKA